MLKGVKDVSSGYAGGSKDNPTYAEVCTGETGHAEVIKIDYDSKLIKLEDLLTVFFASHDPTTLNRQGNDIGTQYRSIILYESEEQKRAIDKFIGDLGDGIVTEVKPLDKFYPAEDYHKDYYKNNKTAPYCQVVINPKLEKVQKRFSQLLKEGKK